MFGSVLRVSQLGIYRVLVGIMDWVTFYVFVSDLGGRCMLADLL